MDSAITPRLRLIAGPNGSGKSVLREIIASRKVLGVYLNADEVHKQLLSEPDPPSSL